MSAARKFKTVKCHVCGEDITREEDCVSYNISLKGKTLKKFHKNCLDRQIKITNELKERNEACDYIKLKILGYEDGMKLPKAMINRLLAMRSGEFAWKKGIKLDGDIYTWEVIKKTFMYKAQDIRHILSTKQFTSEVAKFNYIAVIVENHLNDVYLRMKKQEQANKQLEYIAENTTKVDMETPKENTGYQRKSTLNKVADKLSHLI